MILLLLVIRLKGGRPKSPSFPRQSLQTRRTSFQLSIGNYDLNYLAIGDPQEIILWINLIMNFDDKKYIYIRYKLVFINRQSMSPDSTLECKSNPLQWQRMRNIKRSINSKWLLWSWRLANKEFWLSVLQLLGPIKPLLEWWGPDCVLGSGAHPPRTVSLQFKALV